MNWTNGIALYWKYNYGQDPIVATMKDGILSYDSPGTANIENSISVMYNLSVVYDYYNNVLNYR